ncbi:MAG: bifunctional 5,10-methylene-tetrahydrofolate dehydrogenase/5,10-methylene-tetrahydrofolate cyclohydrolase [Clostridia bacterium]|nr:bifunctional 5,10-methylene-tetrahydrofolate dehydrogenase/5,10-methylene-tetrahydrofolate cyclohydrolase [Clostridia bacterium]
MAEILKGMPVAKAMTQVSAGRVEALKEKGIVPTLAIVRLGEKPSDMSYENGAKKRAEKTGVEVKQFVLPESTTQEELADVIKDINADDSIHGVLMFRPLPKHIDEKAVCEMLDPAKDMDGITSGSMAGVFMENGMGYPPCTASAVMEILDHYGIELKGKKVTIFGRSLVIGKPVAMMVMGRHATITMCHSRTTGEDFAKAGQEADIVIAALGRAKMIDASKLGRDQVIIDVGINVDEEGNLCGDVDFDAAEPRAKAITPVPKGVGSVTTAVLMKHVVEAAEKKL